MSYTSEDSVIVVSFHDDANAYEALTQLKELDSQKQLNVEGAAVVQRGQDGGLTVKDEIGDPGYAGTATGGLVGLLVGILGGPLGILVGGATGLFVGSIVDLDDDDDTESMLAELSKSIGVGRTALLAQVSEPAPEVIDTAMARLDGTVLRRPVPDVEAEISAAEEAQREAKHKARKELRKARHEKHQEAVHAKIADLQEKLHHHKNTPVAS